jgi:DNA-binding transcriptional LysR family regulator
VVFLNLTHIQYFLTAAKCLNFTEAAKILYITQPTLSNTVSSLESELGFKLFIRTKKFVRLTPAGAILYEDFANITTQINSSVERARRANEGTEGTIRIGCLESIDTSFFLPKITKQFSKVYPMVNLVFERHSFRILREKLQSGNLDVIFTFSFEIENMQGVQYETIYSSQAILVLPISNPLSIIESLTLADLKDEEIAVISPDESAGGVKAMLNICKKYNFTPAKLKFCPNLESLSLYLESGLSVALLDKTIRYKDNPNFKLFDVPLPDGAIDIVLAWKNNNLSSTLSLFVNTVLDMQINDFNSVIKK